MRRAVVQSGFTPVVVLIGAMLPVHRVGDGTR
jgi:hypothetical protein